MSGWIDQIVASYVCEGFEEKDTLWNVRNRITLKGNGECLRVTYLWVKFLSTRTARREKEAVLFAGLKEKKN